MNDFQGWGDGEVVIWSVSLGSGGDVKGSDGYGISFWGGENDLELN